MKNGKVPENVLKRSVLRQIRTKREEVVVAVEAVSEGMATEGGGGATAKREAGDVEAAL